MAIYTILLALSVFMIALVLLIIQQTFLHWKRENKEEAIVATLVNRPAVGMMLTAEHCILQRKIFADSDITVYDSVSRSNESLCTIDNVVNYSIENCVARNIITKE